MPASGWFIGRPAQVLPTVDIDRKSKATDPRVCLRPNALIDELALLQKSCRCCPVGRFHLIIDEMRVLWTGLMMILHQPFRPWETSNQTPCLGAGTVSA